MKPLWRGAARGGPPGVAALPAWDRRTGPTESGARPVTGLVDLRLGTFVQRYDLRVERTDDGVAPSLTPIGAARPVGQALAQLAFVRSGAGPEEPAVIATPHGPVTTRLTYRPLGPWHVLDRAAISVAAPQFGAGPEFTVAVLDPRLVR